MTKNWREKKNWKEISKKWSNSKGKEKKWCYISQECVTDEELTNNKDEDMDEVSSVIIIEERLERIMITSTSILKNWIVDSGFLYHMLVERRKFQNFKAYGGGTVKFDNNSPCIVIGKGIVVVNESTTYGDVSLVEGLKYNMLSVSQLLEKGYKFNFNKESCIIFDKIGKLLATGEQRRGNLFYLNISRNTCIVARNNYN